MKSRRKYPTQKRLQELFTYCPSGQLVRRSTGKYVGSEGNPYSRVCIDYDVYYAHILIFIYHHGYRPPFTDHKDRDIKNNCIGNLRPANAGLNSWNRKCRHNKTGQRGVGFKKDSNRKKPYEAYIHKEGIKYYLGYFSCVEAAIIARKKAEVRLYGETWK